MINLLDLIEFLKSKDLIKAIEGELPEILKGWSSDSRKIEKDFLFCVLAGHETDGGQFIQDALQKGANLMLSEKALDLPVGQILVTDTRKAIATIAMYTSDFAAAKMNQFAVTGTNGKTTVAMMLYSILNESANVCAINGTIFQGLPGHEKKSVLTTPGPEELHQFYLNMISLGAESTVLEASSHALDQDRLWGVNFDVAIFTNLSQDHLDYHGDMQTYFEAKKKLFIDLLKQDGSAVINTDDESGRKLFKDLKEQGKEVLSYGQGVESDCQILIGNGGLVYDGARVVPAVLGEFNLYNAAAALLAARAQGIELEKIKKILETFRGVPGRMELYKKASGGQAVVDFAHTPDALEKTLQALKKTCEGKLYVLFGCGGNRDKEKRSLMGCIAEKLADFIILTNDNPRDENPESIIKDIASGLTDKSLCLVNLDRKKAIEQTWNKLQSGDIILIAGKGHEETQTVKGIVQAFSDREIVKKLSEKE